MVQHKRWKKGHSSSSNPTLRRHRDSVKNNIFNYKTSNRKRIEPFSDSQNIISFSKIEQSGLTADALAKLDSKSLSKIKIDDDDEDNQSIGTRDTFQSWASNWSDCTNATFNRVHKYWKSNSALHKEVGNYQQFKRNWQKIKIIQILAVLAAVTEVIKSNEGKESEVEYFAALVS